MAHLFIFFLLLINVHSLQAQTCESLFEETSVLSRLSLEDQNILTQFARRQVEVSVNYSISRDQKESILRHIKDELEYFIESKGLSSREEFILRGEYRSLIFQFKRASGDQLDLQIKIESKIENAVTNQKKEFIESTRRDKILNHLLLKYEVDTLNEALLEIVQLRYAEAEDIQAFKLALELGADIKSMDSEGRTTLHLATIHSKIEIIKILIEKNADISATDVYSETPLTYAIRRQENDIFSLFLPKIKDIKDINAKNGILMRVATSYGTAEMIEHLVANKADFNISDSQGYTPLHIAIIAGNTRTAKLLINLGADIHTTNVKGDTLLHSSVYKGQSLITKILIENNIDVNIRNDAGQTALEIAESKTYYFTPMQREIIALIKGATK